MGVSSAESAEAAASAVAASAGIAFAAARASWQVSRTPASSAKAGRVGHITVRSPAWKPGFQRLEGA
eukprot:2144360-Rhodomonas_salina.1